VEGERQASLLERLVDRFVWASDFPHSDAKYRGVVDELRERNRDLDPEARAGLFGLNALTMYRIPAPRRA
jgi:predicted TIM-barrel fold metal-dependent hydrolase